MATTTYLDEDILIEIETPLGLSPVKESHSLNMSGESHAKYHKDWINNPQVTKSHLLEHDPDWLLEKDVFVTKSRQRRIISAMPDASIRWYLKFMISVVQGERFELADRIHIEHLYAKLDELKEEAKRRGLKW